MVENFIPNNIASWIESSYDLIEIYTSVLANKVYIFEVYSCEQFIHRFTADNNQWDAVRTNNGYVVCTLKPS